jgi:hypothetical protein
MSEQSKDFIFVAVVALAALVFVYDVYNVGRLAGMNGAFHYQLNNTGVAAISGGQGFDEGAQARYDVYRKTSVLSVITAIGFRSGAEQQGNQPTVW